jgi:hypothetical protein
MVNIGLKRGARARKARPHHSHFPAYPGIPSVNEFLRKRLEFSDNLRRILLECVQKPEQPLQSCLLACVMRHPGKGRRRRRPTRPGDERKYEAAVIFFLLRVAFWLTIVLALLPSGGTTTNRGAQAKVDATDAVVAASAAVSDMSSFCDRQPEACVVGTKAAVAIGQRAQAGAKMVFDFVSDYASRTETGSVPAPKIVAARAVPPSPGSQSTLTPSDLDPAWQGPPATANAVPLPRPRKSPHGKA